MAEDKKEEFSDNIAQEENKKEKNTEDHTDVTEADSAEETGQKQGIKEIEKELSDYKNKYLRLYADFENYKRVSAKEKQELVKYSVEEIIKELLPVVDHLELALEHSSDDEASKTLKEGVEMTLKELKTALEKFGLTGIDALGKPFDPSVHHAMSQIASDENEENTVMAEFRKGYMLNDRVLRASLVGVSKKTLQQVKIDLEEE